MTNPTDPAVAAMNAVINGAQRRMDALTKMIEAIADLSYDDRCWCIDSLGDMIQAGKDTHMLPLLGKPSERKVDTQALSELE